MDFRIEVLEARDVPSLRHGYAFSVWSGGELVSDGHIKQSTGLHFATGSQRPSARALRELMAMARRYREAGIAPEAITFTVEEGDKDE